MRDSDYYPAGAANDPRAPYNQSDNPEVEVEVIVSTTLSKETTISTSDYNSQEWEDWETGDEGETIHTGGIDYDFSDTDFIAAYQGDQYTALELLSEFNKLLKWLKDKPIPFTDTKRQALLKASEGWVEDDLYVDKD